MKIIFVVCPRRFNDKSKFISVQLPVNVLYLFSCLIKYGFDVKIIDYNVETFSKEDFIKIIRRERPAVVGFSCMTPSIETGAYLATQIKENFSGIATIVGGPHSTAIPKETLDEFKGFDIVLIGDGEGVIVDLCRTLSLKKPVKDINNLAYRIGNKIVFTEKKNMCNLNRLPFPKRELIDIGLYKKNHISKGFSRRMENMQEVLTTRGCPNKCIFCLTNLSYDKVYFRSHKSITAEFEYCIKKLNARHIYILDDTFVANKKLVKVCCDYFKKNKITWHCNASINFITKEILHVMADSGCKGICYGVESGSQKVLDYIKKGITVKQIEDVFKWSHDAKIDIIEGTFIIGSYSYETIEDVNKTINLIKRIKPSVINVTKITPFPGTESYKSMQNYISGRKWSDYYLIDSRPQWRTRYFDGNQLVKLQKKILISFYLSPRLIVSRILKLRDINALFYWSGLGIDYFRKLLTNKLT